MTSQTRPPARELLFDLRMIIGGLFLVYGVVCLIYGIVDYTAADARRSGGINVNLWAGVGMLVAAVAFIAWTLWRPVDEVARRATEQRATTEPDAEADIDRAGPSSG